MSPYSRSGECHSSHTHKTTQALQTEFHCWGSGGGSRGRQPRARGQPARRGQAKKVWGGAGSS